MIKRVAQRMLPDAVYSRLRYGYGYLIFQPQLWRQRVMETVQRADAHYAPYRLPDPYLRYQVHGKLDPKGYVGDAYDIAETIAQTLARQDVRFQDMEHILDFGCGPGKITQALWLNQISGIPATEQPQLYGTDINTKAIAWCQKNLPSALFSVNDPLPPTRYETGFFDFIYVGSVFTHLDQDFEAAWIAELHRVVKPGGWIIATFHGSHTHPLHRLTVQELEQLETNVFYFRRYTGGYKRDGLPEFYSSAYHTRAYIERVYSEKFRIVDYVERGLRKYQDLLLIRAGQ